MASPPTNAPRDVSPTLVAYRDTRTMLSEEVKAAEEIEYIISNHPIAVSLRSNCNFLESRPHLKIPISLQNRNLMSGTLLGPRKIVVPPFTWNEKGGKSLVQIFYLGSKLSSHKDVVHGGVLATMLDEGLALCCYPALPNNLGLTANFNITYRQPAFVGSIFVLHAKTTRVDGRKAWVEGYMETLVEEGEVPVLLAEASGLYIEPKNAADMTKVYRV